jgi:hypothetical protein
MRLLRTLPEWKRMGLIFAGSYFIISAVLLTASLLNLGGSGESNLPGWIIIFSVYPTAVVMNMIGVRIIVSTSVELLLLINVIVLFGIGSLFGAMRNKTRADD